MPDYQGQDKGSGGGNKWELMTLWWKNWQGAVMVLVFGNDEGKENPV